VQRNEDLLLGKLAVRERICTQQQIDECLQMQSMTGSTAPLGDLLLFKGYLTPIQLKDLLSKQHKKLMNCPSCSHSFTVLTLSDGRTARCPRCKGPLVESGPDGPTRTDAEVATGRIRVLEPKAGPKFSHVCIICDESFEEAVDAGGRVRCPGCQSTFTSNRTL
jgi:uncharacterized paraquat-inducible protein A